MFGGVLLHITDPSRCSGTRLLLRLRPGLQRAQSIQRMEEMLMNRVVYKDVKC